MSTGIKLQEAQKDLRAGKSLEDVTRDIHLSEKQVKWITDRDKPSEK